MQLISVNLWAVLVSAIASMVIGSLWYSVLFGKVWINLMGFTEKSMKEAKEKGMTKSYLIMFVCSLITAYVLAHFAKYAGSVGVLGGLQLGFWVWLGFFATTLISTVLWEGKPVKLYLINVSHYLVTLVVMSIILSVWV